jgi:hypothetical protein
MPRFGPIKRQDLIRYLRRVGFEGPYSGGRHQFMLREDTTIWIPNPHQGDFGRDLRPRSPAEISSRGYFAKPTSAEMSGKLCNGVYSA